MGFCFFMELNKHEEKVLISLYRKYTKDEEWSFIIRVCKDRGQEIGFLKSELDELKSLNIYLNNQLSDVNIKLHEINIIVNSQPQQPRKVIIIDESKKETEYDISYFEDKIYETKDLSELIKYENYLRSIYEISNKKKWFISHIQRCINAQKIEIKKSKKRGRTLNDYIIDVLKSKDYDLFIDYLNQAKILRDEEQS